MERGYGWWLSGEVHLLLISVKAIYQKSVGPVWSAPSFECLGLWLDVWCNYDPTLKGHIPKKGAETVIVRWCVTPGTLQTRRDTVTWQHSVILLSGNILNIYWNTATYKTFCGTSSWSNGWWVFDEKNFSCYSKIQVMRQLLLSLCTSSW